MSLQKNVASQKWRVFAFNITTGAAVTGDAANITAKIDKDWAGVNATDDVNPTEVEDGYYTFDLTQAETNADALDLYPESATGSVQVIGVPASQGTEISTAAKGNLEDQFDGTGLTGDEFPSTQSQLDGIANVGSAVHRPADSYTLTTGTQSANTVAETEALDQIRHEHTDTAGVLLVEYHFLIGSGTPSSIQITGYVTGNNDDIDVFGFDWVSSSYKQIGNIQGSASTTNGVHSFDLFVDMVGSGANEGMVDIKLSKASGLTSALLAIDQIFVAFNQGVEGYELGSVWLDTGASNTNTVVNVDGVARNPVSTMGALNTLLASTNLSRIEVAPETSVTFAASQEAQVFNGIGWTLALGGQSINNSHFFRANVSGVGTAAAASGFHDCEFTTASIQKAKITDSGFSGTVTMTLAGDYDFIDCHSDVAGASAPTFAKTAGQAITAQWRNWQGGINLTGLEVGDTLTIGGRLGTVDLGSPAGAVAVEIRGTYKAITNVGSAVVNLGGAIKGEDVASILVDTAVMQPTVATNLDATVSSRSTFDPTSDAVASVTVVDTTTTNTDMRGTDSAALASVLGALDDVAAAGNVTAADTIMQYIKQLLNELSGSVGIGTMPAVANPANGTNLFEIIRAGLGTTFDTATDSNEQLQIDHVALQSGVDGIPTTTEFEARTILAAAYFDPAIDTVALVTLVNTTTTNTDMRGTDSAALASLWTAARAGALTDWIDGGRLDLLLDSLITEMATATGEPAQGAPGVSVTRGEKIDFLYKTWRNRSNQTATLYQLYNDDAVTVDHKRTLSDDATTFESGETETGP